MGDRWQPTTGDEWFKVTDKRLNILERRTRGGAVGAGGGASTVTRVGPDGVYVLQGGVEVGPFPPAQHYLPTPGDLVWLEQVGAAVVVAGAVDLSYRPTLLGGWKPYNDTIVSDAWSLPRVHRTQSGIVQLTGLLSGGTVTSGTILFTLAPGYRPDTNGIFPLNNADTRRGVEVRANGDVVLRPGVASGTLDLADVMFPAAGVATWTPIGQGGSTYAANISNHGDPQFGGAAFWKDPYGVVWFRGLIQTSAAISADNTPLIGLPATHRFYAGTHLTAVAVDAFVGIGGSTSDGLNFKAGVSLAAGAWISLAPVIVVTADARTLNTWVTPVLGSGWVQYPGAYTQVSHTLRGDGLAMLSGLMNTGSLNGRLFILPDNMRVRRVQIRLTLSNGARGRFDLRGSPDSAAPDFTGAVVAVLGTNVWFSLDNLKWIPE